MDEPSFHAKSAIDAPSRLVPAGALGRAVASLFILLNVASIIVWLMPSSDLQQALLPAVRPYVSATALDQNWAMFAPDPPHINFWMGARITYRNGHKRLWDFNRPTHLPQWKQWVEERRRKWVENLWNPANNAYWPQTALWAARVNDDQPGNPPVHVTLIRFWAPIPPPPNGLDQPLPAAPQLERCYSTRIATAPS